MTRIGQFLNFHFFIIFFNLANFAEKIEILPLSCMKHTWRWPEHFCNKMSHNIKISLGLLGTVKIFVRWRTPKKTSWNKLLLLKILLSNYRPGKSILRAHAARSQTGPHRRHLCRHYPLWQRRIRLRLWFTPSDRPCRLLHQ